MKDRTDPDTGSLLRTVLSGGFWALALRVTSIVAAFASSAVLARELNQADLGRYFLALSLAGFLALLLQFGLSGLVVRDVSRALAERRPADAIAIARAVLLFAVKSSALVVVATTLIAIAGSLWSVGRTGRDQWMVLLLVAVLGGLSSYQAIVAEVLRGFHRVLAASAFTGALSGFLGLIAILVAAAELSGFSLPKALACAAAGVIASCAVSFFFLRGIICNGGSMRLSRSNAADAAPFLGNGLATFLFLQSDIWVASVMLPFDQVAIYGAASRISLLLSLPVEASEAALLPKIPSLYFGHQVERLGRLMRRTAVIQSVLVLAGLALIAVLGGPLLAMLFGPTFAEGRDVALLLACGWFVRAFMGSYGHVLMMTGQATSMMRLTVTWSLTCIPMQCVGGALWGMRGVAAAAALALAMFSVVGARKAQRHLGTSTAAGYDRTESADSEQ